MVYTPTSYDGLLAAAFVQMLVDSSNFQTWCGHAGSSANSKRQVVLDTGGYGIPVGSDDNPLSLSSNWATLRMGPSKRITRALGTWGRGGDGEFMLVEQITPTDLGPDQISRGRDNASNICADLQNLVTSAATRISGGTFELGPTALADPTSAIANCVVSLITFDWSDIP